MLCRSFEKQESTNQQLVKNMKSLVKDLKNRVEEEKMDEKKSFVGHVDPNRQLKVDAEELLTDNLIQGMNATLTEILF